MSLNSRISRGQTDRGKSIIGFDDLILVTGANGFIGRRVVAALVSEGFHNVRCLVRRANVLPTSQPGVEWLSGDLLSREDCLAITENVSVVIHLAAGRGEKLFSDAFINSVVTTRNLLDACVHYNCIKRFVNVSSFAVYSNTGSLRAMLLDEKSQVEVRPDLRGEAYCYAKTKQDELVLAYGKRHRIPYVIVRPGVVYGPGNLAITGRVGISPFGVFLHMGGSNPIPFIFVDNCADAIAAVALRPDVDGEIFNAVDDDLPSSRQFLRQYKDKVRGFFSIYMPHAVSYGLCYLWERYSAWSEGQLPPAFNRRRWRSLWKKTRYSNEKLKALVGWKQRVPTAEGMRRYFEACRGGDCNG